MEEELVGLKKDIKCWERMFTTQNNRKPSKEDIKNATPNIQKCYTNYILLKRRISKSNKVQKDVLGEDLNKHDKVLCDANTPKLPPITPIVPDLRKTIKDKSKNVTLITNNCLLEDFSLGTIEASDTSIQTKANPLPLKKVSGFTNASARYLSEHNSFQKMHEEKKSVKVQQSQIFCRFEAETKRVDKTIIDDNHLTINSNLLDNATPVAKKRKIDQESVKGIESNFVRLNMRNRKYRRPGKVITGEAYKRKQWKSHGLFGKCPPKDWKNPKKENSSTWILSSEPGKSFKCESEGHWANKHIGPIASSTAKIIHKEQLQVASKLDFSCLEPMMRPCQIVVGKSGERVESFPPLLDGSENEEYIEKMLQKGLHDLGYSSFRPGQREAVIRILQGKSTLLILSTGGGKSLVYQLCAYLYHQSFNALTLVISPLISLMDDQIASLPTMLPGRCVHSHMNQKQRQRLHEDITAGKVPLLLLSPESAMGSTSGALPGIIPRIAFVCIDEVHCMSSWSDNFRPAYLRVCDALRKQHAVNTFLGLTATCSNSSSTSICNLLGVNEDNGVIKQRILRDNLHLTVSMDTQKDEALISLLKGERFFQLNSIIIYCTRRQECERVAAVLRSSLPLWLPAEEELCKNKKGKRKRKALDNCIAESYHAGLTPSQRSRVQYHFMVGTLRIVCATVAFGMGLDKANVRSVIHYSMPKSFENYVQEIGRAGRDGIMAHCHIFIDELGEDLSELSKHAHSNTVDRYGVQQLLLSVFKPCACVALLQRSDACAKKDSLVLEDSSTYLASTADDDFSDDVDILINMDERKLVICPGHSVTFPMAELVNTMDVPEENITTMLTYLEMCPFRSWLKLQQPLKSTCHIQCYGGPAHLTALAQEAATILAAVRFYADLEQPTNEIQFPYIELASRMGWDPYIVKRELHELDQLVIPGFKSSVLVEFKDLSFHVHAPGNLTDEEVDEVTDYLYNRIVAQKNAELRRLCELHKTLVSVATSSHYEAACEVDFDRDRFLKEKITNYFSERPEEQGSDWLWRKPYQPSTHILAIVERDIRSFINKHSNLPLTGRVIARIMQGIPSPNYPAYSWGRVREYWRKHLDVDFEWLVQSASNVIARYRLGDSF